MLVQDHSVQVAEALVAANVKWPPAAALEDVLVTAQGRVPGIVFRARPRGGAAGRALSSSRVALVREISSS